MTDKCDFLGEIIGVKKAIVIRDAPNRGKRYPDFRCIECGKNVPPHAESKSQPAHFEHKRNTESPNCSLRHQR